MIDETFEDEDLPVRSGGPLLAGVDEALNWVQFIPLIAAGVSAVGGYLSARKGAKSSTSNTRTGATLGRGDLEGTAGKYRDLVSDYVSSKPGLTAGEVNRNMRQFRRESAAGTRGQQMQTKSYMAQRGIRGAGAAGQMNRIEENRKTANYQARVSMMLQEHAIRESDVARRAAVGAQFLWPAESARGAGQISQVDTTTSSSGVGEGLAAGARFAGEWYSDYKKKNG